MHVKLQLESCGLVSMCDYRCVHVHSCVIYRRFRCDCTAACAVYGVPHVRCTYTVACIVCDCVNDNDTFTTVTLMHDADDDCDWIDDGDDMTWCTARWRYSLV